MSNGNRATTLADQFNQKVADRRKPVDLPIPAIAPDFVFTFVPKRIDVLRTVYKGGLPEHLINQILGKNQPEKLAEVKAMAEEVAAAEVERMTMGDQLAMMDFMRQVAAEVCLEPRIVYEATDDPGAVNLSDSGFVDEIVNALYGYAMGLSPDVPVKTEKGEVNLAEVETFRSDPALSDTGHNGAVFQGATEQTAGAS